MSAQVARKPGYVENYIYGSAAPMPRYETPEEERIDKPLPQERTVPKERAAVNTRSAPSVSLVAVFGSLVVGVLMVFVIIAQISYNEVARETVRLKAQLRELQAQERALEVAFESVVNMKEIERYAKDVLGMSQHDARQGTVIQSTAQDRAEIIASEESRESALRGFGSFISSLTEYFRR